MVYISYGSLVDSFLLNTDFLITLNQILTEEIKQLRHSLIFYADLLP